MDYLSLKMEINIKYILKIYINLVLILKLVVADCGLPAIPYNAHIDKVQQVFFEGDSVEYLCQLEELKLVGSKTRICVNSRWNGTIPRCVEELYYGTISAIDLADRRNHTFEYESVSWRRYDMNAAYHADYLRGKQKCLQSSKMTRPHTWKIHLTKPERHISYIEMVFLDKNKKLSRTDPTKIIKSTKVNEIRDCDPTILETTDTTVRLGLNCFMEFEGDSHFEAWEKDQTSMINIEFDTDAITICEIRIYKNSFMPYSRCGSADLVLHGSTEFIKSGTRFSGGAYYRYSCDKGFKLEGSDSVRCGLNNNWLDAFPTCKPEKTCPYPPANQQSISVDINYEHLYSFDGNISAIVGSVVSYFCVGDHNNKSVMIGDSVRVCGSDGKWSGVDPICIHDYELSADYLKDFANIDKTDKRMTTFQTFDKYVNTSTSSALVCGIPALPLFSKPTSGPKYRLFGGQSDLRHSYENGTVINYQCESAYRWVAGDVGKRICVNGKWTGRVGKCAINWGNKVSLNAVYIFDKEKGQWTHSHQVYKTNATNPELDQHFAFRRDADKEGECVRFQVDGKHRWVMQLNQSVSVTYFTVMLHPGGFFGNKHKIDNATILETSAVTASIGNSQCVLTSAWDYTHARIGTYFFFTCDMAERTRDYQPYAYNINLDIDPKLFDKSYTNRNISLCSLAVLVSKDDCGSPDIPVHSSVTPNYNTKEWTYTCDEGYKLEGSPSVTCGKNGRWSGEFPTCVKREMCAVNDIVSQVMSKMQTNYKNLMKIDGKDSAILDSLANYSCINRKNNKVLIGSEVRVCTKSGQWSGTEPYCMNPKRLRQNNKSERRSAGAVFGIVLAVVVSLGLVAGLIWFAFNKGYLEMPAIRVPNFTIPKINVQRENSVNSMGTGRQDSTIETPKDINANDPYERPVLSASEPQMPKPRSTKINEVLPVFSKGTELLIEPDDIDDD